MATFIDTGNECFNIDTITRFYRTSGGTLIVATNQSTSEWDIDEGVYYTESFKFEFFDEKADFVERVLRESVKFVFDPTKGKTGI